METLNIIEELFSLYSENGVIEKQNLKRCLNMLNLNISDINTEINEPFDYTKFFIYMEKKLNNTQCMKLSVLRRHLQKHFTTEFIDYIICNTYSEHTKYSQQKLTGNSIVNISKLMDSIPKIE